MQVTATGTSANNDGQPSVEVTGTPETPTATGVMVSRTALTVPEEDTTGDSYTVVLDSQPTANVTVTVAGHAGTDVTPNPTTLTFARSNWDTAQTVTVTAGNDADTANDSVTLTHSAVSTDSNYDGITIAGVTLTEPDYKSRHLHPSVHRICSAKPWNRIDQLREPAQRISDHIHEMLHARFVRYGAP